MNVIIPLDCILILCCFVAVCCSGWCCCCCCHTTAVVADSVAVAVLLWAFFALLFCICRGLFSILQNKIFFSLSLSCCNRPEKKKCQFHIIARWEISAMPHVAANTFLCVCASSSQIENGIREIVPHSKWFDLLDQSTEQKNNNSTHSAFSFLFLRFIIKRRYEFWMRRHLIPLKAATHEIA